jgi:microcompartment protein CcmL/EutN
MIEALALIELDSVARGLRCVDDLVKRAPVNVHEANLIEPGKFLILFSGAVAEVTEAYQAACARGGERIVERLLLAMVHPALVTCLKGGVEVDDPDAIGVVEGKHVAGVLEACDRSLKDADVALCGLRLHGGLGGRAYYVVQGRQHDVEAAIEVGAAVLKGRDTLHEVQCVANPHREFLGWLLRPAPFSPGGL